MGQVNTVIIPRNTTIPTKKTQVFSTAADNQTAITVRICQGNRPMFNDNKLLGSFNLEGIPPAPRGVPQEEISINIDANGITTVTAKDLGTGKEANITITSSSGLSKEEVEKAKQDAEKNAEEDKKKMEVINQKNAADGLCFSIEKAVKEAGDKLAEDDKKRVNDEIAKVKESLKSDDISKIKECSESLNKVWEPLVKKLYPQSQAGSQPNFSPEEIEKMKQDPRFASMFGAGGPFAGNADANPSSSGS